MENILGCGIAVVIIVDVALRLDPAQFPEVKWEDDEPTEVIMNITQRK